MRYLCVVVLLAGTVGSAVADQQQSAGGLKGTKPREQPLADIPKEFAFLFHSPAQHEQEVAKRPNYLVYEEELWKGLPYDSISLERGSTGGCFGACPFTTVTFYRSTVSGIAMPAPCRAAPCPSGSGEVRGRAELRTVERVGDALQTRATRISEGSLRIYEFANLSYLLHKLNFLGLPDQYYCPSCPADRVFATVTVVAGGRAKAVTDYGVERPVELWAIQQALDAVSKNIQWTQK